MLVNNKNYVEKHGQRNIKEITCPSDQLIICTACLL